MRQRTAIPIIDIFAGPGGLGEGFSAYTDECGKQPFKIALSIDKIRNRTNQRRRGYQHRGVTHIGLIPLPANISSLPGVPGAA